MISTILSILYLFLPCIDIFSASTNGVIFKFTFSAWYGKNYAWWLGIETLNSSEHDWESDFAPKRSIVICDSCDRSRKSLNMPSLYEEAETEEEAKESSYQNDDGTNNEADDVEKPVLGYTESTVDQKLDNNVLVTSPDVDAQNVV